jgi:hypothetical protein
MQYNPVRLDPAKVPEDLRVLVSARIDPLLHDLHVALTYPRDGQEHPGFNLTGLIALCAVLGGLGTVFYNDGSDNEGRFKKVAKLCREQDQGKDCVDERNYGCTLYDNYRNPLEHNLGLALKADGRAWVPDKLDLPSKAERALRRGLKEEELAEIESDAGWPAWLPATITRRTKGGKARWIVCLDALYCTTRRTVRALAEDVTLHRGAQHVIADWYREHVRNEAEKQAAAMSGTLPKALTNNFASDSTAPAAVNLAVGSGDMWGQLPPADETG